MTEPPPVATMVCSEYQRLLEESQRTRENWNRRRTEICCSPLVRKEAGDELLRLQAKYARAYTHLCNHANTCLQCRPVSRIA
jgi:hypothetical protein